MNTKLIVPVLGILLFATGAMYAQEPAGEEQQPQMMQRMMRQMMQSRRQQMMGQRDALLDNLRASTERLDELVATMDSSQGEAQIDAMTAVLSELVAQRKFLLELLEAQPPMMRQMQMMDMMQMMMGMMTGDDADEAEEDQP